MDTDLPILVIIVVGDCALMIPTQQSPYVHLAIVTTCVVRFRERFNFRNPFRRGATRRRVAIEREKKEKEKETFEHNGKDNSFRSYECQ